MTSHNPYAPPSPQVRTSGIPPFLVIVCVGIAAVLGAFLGRSTAPTPEPLPVATVAAASPANSSLTAEVRTIADPELVEELNACEAHVEELELALDEAGVETQRYKRGLERAVDTLNSQQGARGTQERRSAGARSSSQRNEPSREQRKSADVRTWIPRIAPMGPDLRVWGKVHNLEKTPVEGVLEIELVNQDGRVVDEVSLQLVLEPGLNPWDYVFVNPPSDNYKPTVRWQTSS